MIERYGGITINPEGSTPPGGEDAPKTPKETKSEPIITRRLFLKAGLAAAGTFVVGDFLKTQGIEREIEEISNSNKKEVQNTPSEVTPTHVSEEKSPTIFDPLEQLKVYGRIRDLEAGLEMYQDKHYFELIETKDGLKDIQTAAENIKQYDLEKMSEPFIEKGLPKELAYMIAIQETRGRSQKSSAGARGMTGIMPATAKALGFQPKEADNPYLASRMTAEYLATEREERFGKVNDEFILLHAYNAGGGLFGFTEKTPKEKRTCKNFYRYMEEYINSRYKETKERGYRHTLDEEDTSLEAVSRRFEVPLNKLLKANGFTEKTIIHEGDKVLIPFENLDDAAKIIFRKPLEALQYVPEVKAKFNALKNKGLLRGIDTRAHGNEKVSE